MGKPFHQSLSFYFYHRRCTEFSNTCPHIFCLLLILFFTFIESILENVNYVVCLSFLSNEGDTYVFYENDNDKIEAFIYFSVTEYKTIMDQKIIIISNIKLQIIFSNHFIVGYHEYELRYCSCTYNKHNGFSLEIFLVDMGNVFQSDGVKIFFIYSMLNRIHIQN